MVRRYRTLIVATVLTGMTVASTGHAQDRLRVKIGDLDRFEHLPDRAAFCPPASSTTKDVSPAIEWSPGPTGTQSYALLMTDPDVPKDFSQINKPGVVIAAAAPRIPAYHWVLDDIPVAITSLASGIEGDGLAPHGKPVGVTGHGRRGANIYTTFLASNAEMSGTYGGYDGPCPPVNDERPHRYVVQVFALDIRSLGLSGPFDGSSVERAMRSHVLAEGEAVATYALNPNLRGQPEQ